MDALDTALSELGRALGLEHLAFTEDECRLRIGDLTADLIADRKRGVLVVSAPVAELPAVDRTEALAFVADLNTGPTLGGPALGVPAGSDIVVLTDQIAVADLTTAWLQGRIRLFVAAAEKAQSLLQDPGGRGPSEPLEADPNLLRI